MGQGRHGEGDDMDQVTYLDGLIMDLFALVQAACCFAFVMFAWLAVGGPGLVLLLIEFVLKELDGR